LSVVIEASHFDGSAAYLTNQTVMGTPILSAISRVRFTPESGRAPTPTTWQNFEPRHPTAREWPADVVKILCFKAVATKPH